MKTTVEIPDPLFIRAKSHCANQGISLRELMETGLRLALDPPHTSGPPFRLRPFGFLGQGASIQDWPTIRELAYEGRGSSTDPEEIGS